MKVSHVYDGTHYIIDKVLDHAAKAGGQGDRYGDRYTVKIFTVKIFGRQSYLFFERSPDIEGDVIGRWFVEMKRPKK